MIRRLIGMGSALALFIVSGCSGSLRHDVTAGQSSLDFERRVASIRGLALLQPVPIEVEGVRETGEIAYKNSVRRFSGDRLLDATAVAHAIGLDEQSFDSKAAMRDQVGAEVAGIYDPEAQRVVLAERDNAGGRRLDDAERPLLTAHELAHALQYQHFPVAEGLEAASARYDRYLAFNAVLEGDATFTSLAYVQGRSPDRRMIEAMKARLRDALWSQPGAPTGEQLLEYGYGTLFVMEAFERGGWVGVNRLYAQPPWSCREITEPELYFRASHRPRAGIVVEGYQGVMKGWHTVERDTLGIVPLATILAHGAEDGEQPVSLPLRWSDDQVVALRKGKQLAIIWMLSFDDPDSAWAFRQAYAPLLERADENEPHVVSSRGSVVLVAIGEAARRYQTLGPALWSSTRFK